MKYRDAWRAGFVNKSIIADLGFWQTWRPNRLTLIIVDYAAGYAEKLGDVVRCLRAKSVAGASLAGCC